MKINGDLNNCTECIFSTFDFDNVYCKLLEKAYDLKRVRGFRIGCPLYCDRNRSIEIFIKVHKKNFNKNKDLYLKNMEIIENGEN